MATRKKKTITGMPRGRRPTIHTTSKMSFNLDAELEAELEAEHVVRAARFRDADWTLSSTVRALLREALARSRAERAADSAQPSLPLKEPPTKNS